MMNFSKFGAKLTAKTGILELMEDLGRAMNQQGTVYMLGGGNPSHIPVVEKILRGQMEELMKEQGKFEHIIGDYDIPQGKPSFLRALAEFLHKKYGWRITAENIAVTVGSQNGFFYLFNMLGGEFADGTRKKILLPLCPEYIGYADQGLTSDFFVSFRPTVEYLGAHTFKYHVDFDSLEVSKDVAAICVSRPTNPTGNVVTDEEIRKLSSFAKECGIPFIIDNAYGEPFPNILFTPVKLIWDEHIILAMSLSKFGMPSLRTGIVIARKEIIAAISGINAIVALANTSLAQELVTPLLQSGEITRISNEIIKPFYKEKSQIAQELVAHYFDDSLPYFVHKSEGALFLWFWFKDFPITTKELYERLKKRKVIVVPGSYFFPGLEHDDWEHKGQCIRVNFARPREEFEAGIKIIAEEVKRGYKSAPH